MDPEGLREWGVRSLEIARGSCAQDPLPKTTPEGVGLPLLYCWIRGHTASIYPHRSASLTGGP
jgi:hypothetical protein